MRTAGTPTILSLERLEVRFGGLVAVDGLSFSVEAGEVVGLVGPNGAGKTTVFNAIAGAIHPSLGTIGFLGTSLGRLPSYRRSRLGLARSFQAPALFEGLSVLDNVRVAAERASKDNARHRSLAALREVDFEGNVNGSPRDLALPHRKKVQLARAIVGEPKLLLLDEPAAGLIPEDARSMAGLIRRIRDQNGLSVMLIEHQFALVRSVCDRVVVLNAGRKVAEGRTGDIAGNPATAPLLGLAP